MQRVWARRTAAVLTVVVTLLVVGCDSSAVSAQKEQEQEEAFQRIIGAAPPEDAETSISEYLSDLEGAVSPSAGGSGVDVEITFTNTSSKVIKYATFRVRPFNAVGDSVGADRLNLERLKLTGPVDPGVTKGPMVRKNVWNSKQIVAYDLEWVTIEYMDGSEVEIVPTRPIRLGK